jgi:hypothetical protein
MEVASEVVVAFNVEVAVASEVAVAFNEEEVADFNEEEVVAFNEEEVVDFNEEEEEVEGAEEVVAVNLPYLPASPSGAHKRFDDE